MKRTSTWAVLALAASLAGPLAAAPPTEGEKLHQIFDEQWEWELQQNPIRATFVGDPRYGDRVPDMSFEAIERRDQHAHELKARLQTIDYPALSDDDKLSYDLFLLDVDQDIEGQRFHGELMPINQMGGLHSRMVDLAQLTPKFTAKQVDDLLTRLDQVPVLVDQMIALMEKGLEEGLTPPKVSLAGVAEQMAVQITDDPTKSPIYGAAVGDLPASIPQPEQERLRARAREVVATSVIPAIRKLHAFWVDTYYPRCRETVGLSALPDGPAWYAYRIGVETSTDLTAEQIHQLGLGEVERIRGEMEAVKAETGFDGSMQEFFTFLRTDPRFFYTDPEELLRDYRDIAKRIDPELVKQFGRLPRLTYGVIPVPTHSEKTQTTAYYQPGNLKAGRPGYFFANTYDLKSRPKWEMEALTAHEAVPGHHLQISLAQELEGLPRFRRFGGHTAFVEGWALYCESLGPTLGLYKDPYSHFGQLTYEMWRAIRLVVDTGLHAQGWTRQQAIDYFLKNAGKTEHDVTVEVDRYIVWPGQALAYKIGELKIKELRRYAEEQLGDAFDARTFHDTVLGAGAVPLNILEKRVKAWVSQVKAGA